MGLELSGPGGHGHTGAFAALALSWGEALQSAPGGSVAEGIVVVSAVLASGDEDSEETINLCPRVSLKSASKEKTRFLFGG